MMDLGLAVDEVPQQLGEAGALLLNVEPCARRAHRAVDLRLIAHDAGVLHQRRGLALAVTRNFFGVETVERAAEVLALAQDRDPRQSGLESVEDQLLIERAVVVFGHAPFGVVIGNIERVLLGPRTARQVVELNAWCAHCAAFASPGNAKRAQAGLRGVSAMPPAVSGSPAASASSVWSSRSIASPCPPADEPNVPSA